MNRSNIAIRAGIFHFLDKGKYEFIEDGLLVVIDGLVHEIGPFDELGHKWQGVLPFLNESDHLLIPGFVDGHIHAVQNGVMASYGSQLMDWLHQYTFPYEAKFADMDFCQEDISVFFDEMLSNGTTTAAIYSSVHKNSIECIMSEATERNMRIISGKTNMDRGAPEELLEDSTNTYKETADLIEKYHKYKRISYALSPRFALTSTGEQLKQLGDLKKKYPEIPVQTHISENKEEIVQVKTLFPERKDYLEVYEYYGLLGKNSLLGHAIYLSDNEWDRVKKSDASLIHCPTSNLFLGSGLFDLQRSLLMNIPVALGSDVGGGTSFSMLRTAAAAYEIAALQDFKPSALDLFYILSLGGAKALGLENKIGNFEVGKEADFLIINSEKPSILKLRTQGKIPIEDFLFALMMLGDKESIKAVYLMGDRIA